MIPARTLGRTRALLLVAFVGLMAVLNVCIALRGVTGKSAQGYSDFRAFKLGALMVATGQRGHLYDLAAQAQVHRAMFPDNARDRVILPFNHLAYETLIFLPMAKLPYATSFYLWTAINVFLMIAVALIATKIIGVRQSYAPLVFVAELAFFPFLSALVQGQVSILLLLFYAIAVLELKRGHDFAAGAVLALGLFKFHLVLPFVFALLLRRRWRFVAGFVAGALPVLLVSAAVTGLSGVHDYVKLIAFFQQNAPDVFLKIDAMPNLRGLIMTSLGDTAPTFGKWLVILASGVFVLLLLRVRLLDDKQLAGDIYVALAITFTMLVSFHMHEYDLVPLFIAFVLLARPAWKQEVRRTPLLAFSLLFCCTPLYVIAVWYNSLDLLALVVIALAFYLAWFALPEQCAMRVTAGGQS
jgi:hypothetical protein